MTIDVIINGSAVKIDRDVFSLLLDNSVAGTYAAYPRALDSGLIRFAELVDLARKGDIPFSLFFSPKPLVVSQVAAKTKKLLSGVSKETFSIGSRAKVELRDVELIVKDLIRKQELLKKHDPTLHRNKIIGLLRNSSGSNEADAQTLLGALGIPGSQIRSSRTKERALDLIIDRLEANQILVSRSVQNYMPQRLTHVRFSGMTIRDPKVPYIFLAGGEHGDHQEPSGRTVFTLALMAVLMARRVFAPVTWDGQSTESDLQVEYDIAGAMLMPAHEIATIAPITLGDVKVASELFKVTPSAVTIRSMRLGLIDRTTAQSHLENLRVEFEARPKPGPRRQIRPENAVRKYNGREFSSRMLAALDTGSISPKEFCRVACLNNLKPYQITDLRKAVQ